jgi:hypothetical protein
MVNYLKRIKKTRKIIQKLLSSAILNPHFNIIIYNKVLTSSNKRLISIISSMKLIN